MEEEKMLYPRENSVRGVIDLGGVWNFKLGDEKEPGDSFAMGEDTELMAVPASYNDQKDDPKYRNHYGWAYYERKITVPSYLKGQRLVLRFDAVTHAAKVYLNGRFLTAHKGGFLPFEVDVTDQLVPGETAELVVAADNRVNHSTLPVGNEGSTAFFGSDNPGVPSVEAAKVWRKPQNLPNFDFFNYAGINRPVRIYTTPAAYIEDITLVPDIDGDTGVVNYEIKTAARGWSASSGRTRTAMRWQRRMERAEQSESRMPDCGGRGRGSRTSIRRVSLTGRISTRRHSASARWR